ncbi:MAG: 4-demethylwyosine synthase TYW1 [Candidatus Diapherotrites archaeon]|nr:4-demethylwyosine synthase TYW1 [Candidatus Diapherotrites archaeon]
MYKTQIPLDLIKNYEKQQYKIVGKHKHSAVKTCLWTKRSLRNKGVCYKQKFYGVPSHRCLQMTPSLFWCDNRCLYCWRNTEVTLSGDMNKFPIDEPKEIISQSIEAQRSLLSGFPGHENLNKKKFKEALNPNQVAISLSGEPTLYPRLSELIDEFHKREFTTFLVSNGLHPEVLEKLSLPTQLYISMEAPDEQIFKKLDRPLLKDAWKRFNETLSLLPSLSTRKAIRITAMRGLNMSHEKEFAKIIEKAEPNFVEVKGYMFLGYSRQRMKKENMPFHSEVKEFAEKINNHLNYTIAGESQESRVVLLSSGAKKLKIKNN